MVTFDKLPMRDVLVYRLKWPEEDARAFLDALATPTEHLATKEEVEAVRTELVAFRAEVRAEFAEHRTEVKAELAEHRAEVKAEFAEHRAEVKAELETLEQRLIAYIDQRLGELDRRFEEIDRRFEEFERRILAEMKAMVRAAELRMAVLYIGGFGALIGLILART